MTFYRGKTKDNMNGYKTAIRLLRIGIEQHAQVNGCTQRNYRVNKLNSKIDLIFLMSFYFYDLKEYK